MSTRRNGGIIGPQNRTTSVSAPGVWHLDDNQESVYARNWPGFSPNIPNSPALGTVTVSGTTATIPFTLGYNGGSPITSITAIIYPGGTKTILTGSPPTSPITVTGLSGGSYYFAVYATNAVGDSAYSISNTVSITTASYLVVAGGGGGGYNDAGGGGGGGVLTGTVAISSGITYSITVGAGGSGSSATGNSSSAGLAGSNSSISGSGLTTITAVGGGAGAGFYAGAPTVGGSGGGSNYFFPSANGTSGQGYAGGTGGNVTTGYYIGGGGGGAGAAGGNASTTAGTGGNGLASSITGSSVTYAGGGGGGGDVRTLTGSVYFDGSSYLSAPDSSALVFGSSNFTVECWFYLNTLKNFNGIFCKRASSGQFAGPVVNVDSSGTVQLVIANTSSSWGFNQGMSSGITTGTWYHFAVVRNGTTLTTYLNGVGTSASMNFTIYDSGSNFYVGCADGTSGTQATNGYISNFRYTKSVIYSSNFTPPTTILPVVANTSLLTCYGTGFFDASPNNAQMTYSGGGYNTTTSPFTTQTANIAGVSGGTGGGGNGGGSNGNATTGTVNTGGGGGGGAFSNKTAAAGGSGVVILSIPTTSYSANVTGSPTVTTSGSNTIIKYTGNGTYTA